MKTPNDKIDTSTMRSSGKTSGFENLENHLVRKSNLNKVEDFLTQFKKTRAEN